MSSSIKLILAGVFAVVLVYLLTANSILQRVSYDIYECSNRSQGTAKLWFKKIKVGERFEFTWNSESKFLAIDEVSDEKVSFSDDRIAFKLDLTKLRLHRDENGAVVFFNCKLNEFRM